MTSSQYIYISIDQKEEDKYETLGQDLEVMKSGGRREGEWEEMSREENGESKERQGMRVWKANEGEK